VSARAEASGARAPEPATRWTPVRTDDGTWTLRDELVGEACHSSSGAWLEARERYALPCGLARAGPGPVSLLDVGTGLGWNLAAALAELAPRGVPLVATTLEREPALLELVLAPEGPLGLHAPVDPGDGERWLRPVHAALRRAFAAASAAGAGSRGSAPLEVDGLPAGELRLVLGDARATLPGLAPGERFDAVFLDPFSPARAPELWEPAFLAEVARRMAPGARLSTYSAAARVRAALAAAGLEVRPGPPVGRKREGTLAGPPGALGGAPDPILTPGGGDRPAPVD